MMKSTNLVVLIYLVNILVANFYLNKSKKQNVVFPKKHLTNEKKNLKNT